jgi:hypothetical protein
MGRFSRACKRIVATDRSSANVAIVIAFAAPAPLSERITPKRGGGAWGSAQGGGRVGALLETM